VVIGLPQRSCSEDIQRNREETIQAVHQAADAGAQIICLQELYSSPYFCQKVDPMFFDWAEPIRGPSFKAFSKVAEDRKLVIVVPFFERRAPGVYHNSAMIFDADGSLAGLYRKMHIPDDPQYYEKFYFTPGDAGFQSVRTRYARVGVLICWDQWFPEAARLTTLCGADIIFYPTAIGWLPVDSPSDHAAQLQAWMTVQRGHAIANGVFVAAANRVGLEGEPQTGIRFWGHSFVADPQGVVLKSASAEQETLIVECDLNRIEEVRRLWPFLRDRRVDAYRGIRERFLR
jgi:N-carbamoylputrescine amidase